jgi:predicted DNA-binding transcriptional regulator AlpA
METINMEKVDYAKKYAELAQKRWLNTSELEAEYGFSTSWQAKARMVGSESTLPYVKLGKFVRYDRQAIDAWLEDHAVVGGDV